MNISINNKDLYCEAESEIIGQLVRDQKITEACDRISTVIAAIANSNDFVGKALTSKVYDNKIIEISNHISDRFKSCDKNIDDSTENRVCILVTELYKTGGHTELARLIKNIFPSSFVIATNYFGKFRSIEQPVHYVKEMPDLVLPVCSAEEKINILTKFLKNFKGRVILITHHHDVVALIAAINSTKNPIFIFHSDHRVSLGHTIKNFIHVALVPETKKTDPKYAGFYKACQSVPDYGKKEIDDINLLKTCTIGGGEKFFWEGDLTLPKIISNCIINNKSLKHYHIGPLNLTQIESIKQELVNLSLDPSKFINVQSVNSVWDYVVNSDINLVIGSAPIHGTRSAIEIMGAGVPFIPFSGNDGHADMDQYFYPKNIEKWKNLEDLTTKIEKIQINGRAYALSMRFHYESNFSFDFAKKDFDDLMKLDENLYHSPKLFNP
jgi:hypothetical protein